MSLEYVDVYPAPLESTGGDQTIWSGANDCEAILSILHWFSSAALAFDAIVRVVVGVVQPKS
ncbi:hypothetical protein HYG77_00480 [Rhodococcus sp. ZPP]|uniref:hypothetical protein n=1 Tax=Rhodococcus sp. ZPP TaxID=2749906 RepID=UPI001AD88F24|nr:hypothetical protein [Rhodococcus sp. ZPP]QTJ64179.1 hypothetical protein HYG77_00480 [Rhodococcus sp. ZPP]